MREPLPRRRDGRGAALALLLVLAAPACARQGSPPGGPEDRRAPVVVATRPDTFATLEAVDDPILVRFNERISERVASGTLDDAVLVSPRTGEVRVEHARDAIEVDLSGGFRPGVVYRVTVLPVIQDMFGNTMLEPFEFLFSTGAPFAPNVVAGMVVERTTGEPAAGYAVRARPADAGADTTLTHVGLTDPEGFFALRYVPAGRYELTAFEDLDRDDELDFAEARGSRSVLFRQADTLIVEVPVLRPDTSRAVLGSATVLDSVSIELRFDDFLDPDAPVASLGVALEPDTAAPADAPPAPEVVRVMHEAAWRALLDSVAAAQGREGEAPPPPESRIPRPGEVPSTPGQGRGRVAGAPLPSQNLYLRLEEPLPPNVPYRVTVTGVVNINGVSFGGGTAIVMRQPPPAPAADTLPATDAPGAPVDTLPAAADTLPAADTVSDVTDTVSSAADTVPPVADTVPDVADTIPTATDALPPPADTVPSAATRPSAGTAAPRARPAASPLRAARSPTPGRRAALPRPRRE